ncbi:hypothetical protein [Frigidibacter sp. MR17.24]|uniref:hypothetical protein n=1 Tax=Frigidibacter sp. MR17.24 TaxID=3127345 RepID=UPI003012D9D9
MHQNGLYSAVATAIAGLALSGCLAGRDAERGAGGAPVTVPEAAARAACLRDVRRTTGTADAAVTAALPSGAGTEVWLRVGPTGRWHCLARHDGTTAEIRSLTDEGAL